MHISVHNSMHYELIKLMQVMGRDPTCETYSDATLLAIAVVINHSCNSYYSTATLIKLPNCGCWPVADESSWCCTPTGCCCGDEGSCVTERRNNGSMGTT
jgi:hypothetical protein